MNKSIFFKTGFWVILFLLNCTSNSFSQTFAKVAKVNFMYNASPVSKSLYVRSNALTERCDPEPKPIVRKAILYALMDWKGNYDNTPGSTTQYTVTLDIKGYNSFTGTSGLLATYVHTLIVNTNKPQSYVAIDFTGLHTTVNRFVVTATYFAGGTANPNVQAVVQTDVYYSEEFDYDVTNNLGAGPMLTAATPLIDQNEITFKWVSACPVPAPNHQFQLLRLYNTNSAKTISESDVDALVDWNKALTIETGNSLQELTLTMAEGNGYYLWRVRPIGNAYEGGIADDRNWGLWSTTGVYTQGTTNSITNSLAVTTVVNPYLLFYVQPAADAAHNWIFSRSFVEGDALKKDQVSIGESISYANGLQMVQQVQAKISSEDKVLTNQTIYDYSGRPALSTLPAPVNQGTLGYISSFIKNSSSVNYTAADFDENTNYLNPGTFLTTGAGPGQYYSDNNNLENDIPSADGYPYSRVLYMRDGTSKPKESSSPGITHKLGNTASNRHTTRNYISGVAPIEVITVFGDEAPGETDVIKSVTTDANNQSSISYISKEGQTIATCLSGPPPANLDALESLPATPMMIDYYIDNNSPYGSHGLIAQKSIVLTENTNVQITYNITPNAFTDNCLSFCATCDYSINIKIINNDDPDAAPLYNYTKIINPTSGTSGCAGTPLTDFSTPVNVNLDAGSYTIQRTIESNQINPLGNLSATPAAILPNTPYVDQYVTQITNAIQNNFTSGTAVVVDDAGAPVIPAVTVPMTTLWSYLNVAYGAEPNLEGLYTLLGVTTQDHVNIKINCDIVRIPIQKCPSEECPPGNNFEQYLIDWCAAKGLSYATVSAKIIPGYATGEFNTVIANMIDPACGAYDCVELFKCWKNLIASYESYESMAGTSLDASMGGMTMPPGMVFTPDYLDMFLSCAGYKIKGISSSVGGAGCSDPGYKFHPYAYFNYGPQCLNCEKAFYAVINGGTATFPFTTQADFITYYNTFTAVPYTITVTNAYGTVTVSPKDDFKNCIKLCNTTGGTETATVFDGTAESSCKTTCESRYSGFVNQLIETYHKIGKYVEGDAYTLVYEASLGYYIFSTTSYTGPPDITLETIYCQAQKLVEACKSKCALTVVTSGGVTSLGTSAEITAMSNAMYGSYALDLSGSPNCTPQTSPLPAGSFVKNMIAALNQQLAEQRAASVSDGMYWDFKSFLANDFSSYFASSGGCGSNQYVFVHPNIPSYFDYELVSGTTYRLVYYFNKVSSGLSGISPKVLYSSSLITAATPFGSFGFNYINSPTKTGAVATSDMMSTGIQAYHMGSGFTVVNGTPGEFTQLNIYGGLYTGTSTLYKYELSTTDAYGYYKIELCNNISGVGAVSCPNLCYTINPIPSLTTSSPFFTESGITFLPVSCAQQAANEMINTINNQVSLIISNASAKLRDLYKQTCIDLLTDELKVSYGIKYHHYTLFYYDRAGNLVKTVPPKGVVTGATSRMVHPAHTFVTEYAYNSLQQMVRQKTPDGGESLFWYDEKGRIRFSQSAKQLLSAGGPNMSYTKYDILGRVFEAGEMPASPTPVSDATVSTYPSIGMTNIVRTVYSTPASVMYFGGKSQRYLQNRVSYVYSDVDGSLVTTNDQVNTYYSYDPHGNVEWLIQDIPDLGKNYIAYEYDLISGNVIKVKYNEAFPDKFFHRYTYDTDKRIKSVETSKDDVYWEKEADYSYYLHGPLKRIELGHDKVQGIDYAYTIQGWLKSMNHIEAAHDPGKDGNESGNNSYIPKDMYGMMLGYYDGDYMHKNSRLNSNVSNPYHLQASTGRNLYNGNICSWSSRYDIDAVNTWNPALPFEDKTVASGRQFEYDELNRIKKAQYLSRNPAWATSANYLESFKYDANGNITNVERNGFGSTPALRAMDSFTYNYYSPTGNNRLQNVIDDNDNSNPSLYNDIKTQTAFPNNYTYDASGNLLSDAQESITAIEWNPSGKVSKIVKTGTGNNKTIEFMYDAMGHRVSKKVYDHTAADLQLAATTTYYVLDASGNTMALYNRTNTGTSPNYTAKFDLQEQPVYGSERLGERSLANEIFRTVPYTTSTPPSKQNLPASVHTSGWPKLPIPLSNTTSKQLYTRRLNTNSATNVATDLGSNEQTVSEPVTTIGHVRNQAVIMDESGNIILSGYTYTNSATGSTGIGRLYGYSNMLIGNSDLINSNPSCQSMFVKKPGSAGEYYYVTIGNDNKPYYHVIDVTTGILTSYNNLIENVAGYGQGMAIIDDRVGEGLPTLYLRRLSATTTSINIFNITSDGIVPSGITPVTFGSDAAAGPEGEIKISANGLKMAVANTTLGVGEVRVFNLSTNHQTLTYTGRLAMSAGSSARYLEFSANDVRLYFTQRTTNTQLYNVNVGLFVSGATNLAIGSATLVTTTTSPLVGGIRRGSNNNIYYTTNTTAVPNTLNIHMITATETTPVVGAANAIASIITNGSLPLFPHIIDYSSPTTIPPVLVRNYKQKVYELKDHLSNVHSTVYDYKIPLADPTNLIADKRFDNATTESFIVGTGSPAGTTVTNLENRMRVFGTLNSTAHLATALSAGTYIYSFDYVSGTASMGSYSLYAAGNVNITGTLTGSGRYNIPVQLPSASSTNIKLICQDAGANKTFFIDNLLTKKVNTTISDPVVVLNHTGITPSGWTGTNGTVTYATGNIQLSSATPVTNASISKNLALTPGLVYKINFNLTTSVGSGTPRVDLKYTDNGSSQPNYKAFIRSTSGGPTAYEYYIIPETGGGTLAFTYENGTAQLYSFTVNNLIITQYQNQSKALYAAAVQSMQDYYAFGMIMPGKSASTPSYRYGFQGQEKDDDISGSGNLNTAEFWQYDTRLGRRWNMDPVVKHHESPYAAFANNPIWLVDPNGKDTAKLHDVHIVVKEFKRLETKVRKDLEKQDEMIQNNKDAIEEASKKLGEIKLKLKLADKATINPWVKALNKLNEYAAALLESYIQSMTIKVNGQIDERNKVAKEYNVLLKALETRLTQVDAVSIENTNNLYLKAPQNVFYSVYTIKIDDVNHGYGVKVKKENAVTIQLDYIEITEKIISDPDFIDPTDFDNWLKKKK